MNRSLRTHYAVFLAACIASQLAACSDAQNHLRTVDGSQPMTNLGPEGNALVASTFAQYKKKASGCTATGSGRRVLLSGFGLFTGVPYNISGVTIASMARPGFMPAEIDLSRPDLGMTASAQALPAPGMLTAEDHGGHAVTRSVSINGNDYEVCFLTLDVLWDLAGAIIVHEMESFQPELVIMTGRGGAEAIFEGGATNRATILNGYNYDGSAAGRRNTPVESYVLPAHLAAPGATIAMTWNNELLRERSHADVDALGFELVAAPQARPSNEYICNNVSYLVLQAVRGTQMELAGGALTWQPRISGTPQVGFLHLPAQADNDKQGVSTWAKVLLTSIDASLR